MLVDGDTLSADTVIRTDVCIIGTGPAGLTLALELADQPVSVTLLESGGVPFDPSIQALAAFERGGTALEPAPDSRRRQLGGTPHAWNTFIGNNQRAARYLPFDEIDFEARAWVPFSGWPFSRTALDPYYRRAEHICGIPPSTYRAAPAAAGVLRPLAFPGGEVETTVEQFGYSDTFVTRHLDTLAAARNTTVVCHATVTEIATNAAGTRATHLRVNAGAGRAFTVEARVIVLAAGGIENARLLLLSNGANRDGLGNQHDLVGRFFMDHHRINGGTLVPFDRRIFNALDLYDLRQDGSRYLMGKLTLAPDLMRRERMLNTSTLLWPRPIPEHDAAVDAVRPLVSALRRGRLDARALRHARTAARGLPYIAGTGLRLAAYQRKFPPAIAVGRWSSLPGKHKRFSTLEVLHQVEQAPNPNNRVLLGGERDQLGQPRARVESRWSEVDLHSMRRMHEILADQFERSGIGRIGGRSGEFPDLHNVGGINHHMGTTRMHENPKLGVVDADARVHGVANVFVAGSSVFPTGGYANPTLTIVALSLRLADHIKTLMQRREWVAELAGGAPNTGPALAVETTLPIKPAG